LLDREYEAGFPLSERRRQREEGGYA